MKLSRELYVAGLEGACIGLFALAGLNILIACATAPGAPATWHDDEMPLSLPEPSVYYLTRADGKPVRITEYPIADRAFINRYCYNWHVHVAKQPPKPIRYHLGERELGCAFFTDHPHKLRCTIIVPSDEAPVIHRYPASETREEERRHCLGEHHGEPRNL